MTRALLSLGCLLLASIILLAGCGEAERAGDSESGAKGEEVIDTASEQAIIDDSDEEYSQVIDGVYKDSSGHILCPVMHVVIESEDLAEGSFEYEGVTYYFSTKEAEEAFIADPESFIE